MSCHSGRETSRYFRPLISLLSGGRSSFGISIRRELGGSSPYKSRCFCRAICPLRERNQLMKTLAALGFGAPLIRLIDPPPVKGFHLLSKRQCRTHPPEDPGFLPSGHPCNLGRWQIFLAPTSR